MPGRPLDYSNPAIPRPRRAGSAPVPRAETWIGRPARARIENAVRCRCGTRRRVAGVWGWLTWAKWVSHTVAAHPAY